MAETKDPRHAEPRTNPVDKADESNGPIKKEQVKDAGMRGKNLPRGSEPETHAASHRR